MYVDRVLKVAEGADVYVPTSCPPETQVLNGAVLGGGTAHFYVSEQYPDPQLNAWMVRMGSDSGEAL